jgi:hypothetical protein
MIRQTFVFVRAAVLVVALALLVTLAPAAEAASPNYKYAEGGWLYVDPDGASSDSGWFLGGQFGTKRWQVFGEYGDPGDFESWYVGAGWHGLLGKKADLVANLAYVDADIDDGFRIQAGVRWMLLERLELRGFLTHTNLDLTDLNTVELGAIWNFARRLGVGAAYEFGDEGDTARAFVRFNFGKQ